VPLAGLLLLLLPGLRTTLRGGVVMPLLLLQRPLPLLGHRTAAAWFLRLDLQQAARRSEGVVSACLLLLQRVQLSQVVG
jgi:hypothetical protein